MCLYMYIYKSYSTHIHADHNTDWPEFTSVFWATLREQLSDDLTSIEAGVGIGVLNQSCQQCYKQHLQYYIQSLGVWVCISAELVYMYTYMCTFFITTTTNAVGMYILYICAKSMTYCESVVWRDYIHADAGQLLSSVSCRCTYMYMYTEWACFACSLFVINY